MPSLPGLLTRILLLIPLLAGARIDCGAELPRAEADAVSSESAEADCHHASAAVDPRDESPAAPQQKHQHSGLPLGHCPVFHSCALDFAFLANLSAKPHLGAVQPPHRHSAALPLLSQLPEVPPPRA